MKKPPYFEISLGTLAAAELKVLKRRILRKSTLVPSVKIMFSRIRYRKVFNYQVKLRDEVYYYDGKKTYDLIFTLVEPSN